MNLDTSIYSWYSVIAMVLLFVAFILSFIRLVRGPGLPDRVVALDLIAFTFAAMIIVYVNETGFYVLLDTTIILPAIIFLGTVSIARYLKKTISDD